jgi:hypothetical protein
MQNETPETTVKPEGEKPETKLEGLAIPEAPAPQEVNAVVEQPTVQQPVQVQDDDTQTTPAQEETNEAVPGVINEDDRRDEQKDKTWVQKANDVIKEYEEQPYEEEEASEKLQEDYLKQRFNIDVEEEGKN